MFINSNSSTNSSISRSRWTRRLYRAVTAAIFGTLVLAGCAFEEDPEDPNGGGGGGEHTDNQYQKQYWL